MRASTGQARVDSQGRGAYARLLCWLACALACWASLHADSVQARVAALARATPHAIDELAASGGILDERGQLLIPEALRVQVVATGGPMWVAQTVDASLDESTAMQAGASAHLLRVEGLQNARGFAVQSRLWRNGWDLRLPDPLRRRMQPELFAWACALGIILYSVSRISSLSLFAAGVAAWLALHFTALGPPLAGWASASSEVASAPLWLAASGFVAQHDQAVTAGVTALVVFCAVLAYFDHRRSREAPGALSLPVAFFHALAFGLGGAALLEAALRSGWWDALSGAWGVVGLVGLVLACVCARFATSMARVAA